MLKKSKRSEKNEIFVKKSYEVQKLFRKRLLNSIFSKDSVTDNRIFLLNYIFISFLEISVSGFESFILLKHLGKIYIGLFANDKYNISNFPSFLLEFFSFYLEVKTNLRFASFSSIYILTINY